MTTANYRRPLPRIRESTKPFWDACKKHELRVQKCTNCGTFRFPYRPMCASCNSTKYEWAKVNGTGQIFSFITVPAFPMGGSPMGTWPRDDYPINIAIIELPDAGKVHIVSNIVDCPFDKIKVGMPVELVFEDVTNDITLPKFKPSASEH